MVPRGPKVFNRLNGTAPSFYTNDLSLKLTNESLQLLLQPLASHHQQHFIAPATFANIATPPPSIALRATAGFTAISYGNCKITFM
ncbi:hypothetical protein OIU77_027795 [Salix suchowensis]|uniref:Uncharacterized protein n=1 Tax=Salix suchowensis TaxID=1278906 RepID=A0ABQ9BV82_9ROSI|nr:hypothetical protein OIU77_027795 [Salix suchowensis]